MAEQRPVSTSRTWFAPALRTDQARVAEVAALVAGQTLLREMIDAVPVMVAVLNEDRQIVAGNAALVTATGAANEEELLGRRPGEVFRCQHATSEPGGCGTSRFCQHCGAAQSVLSCFRGEAAVEECRITREGGDATLDFQVWARPLVVQDEALCIFSIVDIGNEKRREALERIFFHDVLSTAGAVLDCLQSFHHGEADKRASLVDRAQQLTHRLVGEIQGQRELRAAENGDLTSEPTDFEARALLNDLRQSYTTHPMATGLHIVVVGGGMTRLALRSDRNLLLRVLGNMVKNALEASVPGDQVTLAVDQEEDEAVFSVHNPTAMPLRVQRQVFHRSFSTKGAGRGLGTYSMRLLTERYLGGCVDFNSASDTGTTFRVRIPLQCP